MAKVTDCFPNSLVYHCTFKHTGRTLKGPQYEAYECFAYSVPTLTVLLNDIMGNKHTNCCK